MSLAIRALLPGDSAVIKTRGIKDLARILNAGVHAGIGSRRTCGGSRRSSPSRTDSDGYSAVLRVSV